MQDFERIISRILDQQDEARQRSVATASNKLQQQQQQQQQQQLQLQPRRSTTRSDAGSEDTPPGRSSGGVRMTS